MRGVSPIMRFTKMHGAGNDYIYVDGLRDRVPDDLPDLARRMSDRRRGVGADGLVILRPAADADARMEMYNADGSRSEMCGNALRCIARLLFDRGHVRERRIRILTDAGLRIVDLEMEDGAVRRARASLGAPRLDRADVPMTGPAGRVVDEPFAAAGREFRITALSLGNPHCVAFVDDVSGLDLATIGPAFERHQSFPARVNAHFAEILASDLVRCRTFERGSGETFACGTGAAAILVAGVLTGRTGRVLRCRPPGGELVASWATDGELHVAGPAEEAFTGEWAD